MLKALLSGTMAKIISIMADSLFFPAFGLSWHTQPFFLSYVYPKPTASENSRNTTGMYTVFTRVHTFICKSQSILNNTKYPNFTTQRA